MKKCKNCIEKYNCKSMFEDAGVMSFKQIILFVFLTFLFCIALAALTF